MGWGVGFGKLVVSSRASRCQGLDGSKFCLVVVTEAELLDMRVVRETVLFAKQVGISDRRQGPSSK